MDGTLKHRARSLDAKEAKCSGAIEQLGRLTDLDPKSVENYSKYLAKDQQIDEYFEKLFEQNVLLEARGEIVYENAKRNNAGFELLEEKIENVTQVAEKAVGMADKVNRWLKARGTGMVVIYVVVILLVLAVAYSCYKAWGGAS